jgi:hypothetical protein
MAKVSVSRSGMQRSVVRNAVKPGEVFSLVKRNGTVGRKLYMALGNNGRLYSINLENGALAGTGKPSKTVAIVGKGHVTPTYYGRTDGRRIATTRVNVKSGDIFQHKDSDKSYLALGTLKDGRFASVNMADPFNDDYAVGTNAKSHVTVIGHAEFHAQVAA